MVDYTPLLATVKSSVVGDMRSPTIAYFGKIPMMVQSSRCDARVKLLDVASVPGVRFNQLSFHRVKLKCLVTLHA